MSKMLTAEVNLFFIKCDGMCILMAKDPSKKYSLKLEWK